MTTIFFIGGLMIGSFLNVIVYRLRLAETILGRSYCPHCKAKIRWYDNIPLLSFILLKAKCRDCGEAISWRYPIIELFTGIVFALVAKYFLAIPDVMSYWRVGFVLIIFSLFIVLLAYDWQFMEMPMTIFWILLAVIFVYLLFNSYVEHLVGLSLLQLSIVSGILGGIIAWLFFFVLVFFSKEKWMGWGDVYVGFLSGLFLGWQNIFMGLLLSFMIGSLYAVGVLLFKRGNLKTQVPFIPFLVMGTMITFFVINLFPLISQYLYF
ncbi:MAG TPA: prepilin peptidase [Candidatus Moranbacteria bacterium]|nr:prepilin peptidase [Candidatus Moranbacteria bacterium]